MQNYRFNLWLVGIMPFVVFMSVVALALGHVTPDMANFKYPTYSRAIPRKIANKSTAFKNQKVRIAIIDTGYEEFEGLPDYMKLKLCDSGHYDFRTETPTVGHSGNPHGTIVASIIAANLQEINYCAVIYQVETIRGPDMLSMLRAFTMASREGLMAVNVSIEGISHSYIEKMALQKLASKGTLIFIAAGNRNVNLSMNCISYPGCYKIPNTILVGATGIDDDDHKAGYSNYGQEVTAWYPGSITFAGERVNGTSFAAPRALADFVWSLVSLPELLK